MEHVETERRTMTVLVALDESPGGEAALEAAITLAASARAELRGLFIEDDILFRVAGLPFSLEFSSHSPQPRPMSVHDMQRRLTVSAEIVRRAFERLATRARIHWSFEVVRGAVVPVTLEHFELADVVFIGRHGISPQPSTRAAHRVLSPSPLLAVFDGEPASVRMLRRAAALAVEQHAMLEIYLVADGERTASDQLSEAVSEVANYPVRSHVHPTRLRDASDLLSAARLWRPRLLVLGADNRLLDPATLERLVTELDCPVVLGK